MSMTQQELADITQARIMQLAAELTWPDEDDPLTKKAATYM